MRRRLFSSFTANSSTTKGLNTGVYIVPTPIGNLQDITERSLYILRNATLIAAEDTRQTAKLLSHFGILNKTVWSYYSHNSFEQTSKLVKKAKSGEIIALVSDAGTPGICDPGAELVAACVEENIPVYPIPGPSALTAALSVCGFDASQFTFLGFPPSKGSERVSILQSIKTTKHVVVFFEAPHRVLKTMTELSEMGLDDRLCVCCRELSKIHEEIWRGSIKEAVTWLSHRSDAENRIRGEFTIILGPWIPKGLSKVEAINQIQLYLEKLESDGVSRSEAVAIVTDKNGVLAGGWEFRKSDVYKIALNMNWNEVKRKEM